MSQAQLQSAENTPTKLQFLSKVQEHRVSDGWQSYSGGESGNKSCEQRCTIQERGIRL